MLSDKPATLYKPLVVLPITFCLFSLTIPADLSLPKAFLSRMQASLGDEMKAFLAEHQQPSPVSIRLNPYKTGQVAATDEVVGWAETGKYLAKRPIFALDPHWHAGGYYVQEASSMFLEQAWKMVSSLIEKPPVVLDLCAAPGGKSTHLASLLPAGSLLVANEVIRPRAQILAENVTKWGTGNVVVTNSDPRDFGVLEGVFDTILIDAPCSGEGMFRKDPAAVLEWSAANVKLCAERQRRILADVWQALRPGGFLIYSTCTYNTDENEQILQWLAANYPVKGITLPIDKAWGIEETDAAGLPGYRFYPHRVRGEGLFMALLQKTDGPQTGFRKIKKPVWQKATRKETEIVSGWVQQPNNWEWLRWQEKMVILPAGTHAAAEQIAVALRIVYAGVDVAEIIRDQANPLPALALFTQADTSRFAVEETDLETALRFLKKEEIALTEGKGWKLITYRNLPLGWVKQIGLRANNYFPNEWRLRMDWREIEKLLADTNQPGL